MEEDSYVISNGNSSCFVNPLLGTFEETGVTLSLWQKRGGYKAPIFDETCMVDTIKRLQQRDYNLFKETTTYVVDTIKRLQQETTTFQRDYNYQIPTELKQLALEILSRADIRQKWGLRKDSYLKSTVLALFNQGRKWTVSELTRRTGANRVNVQKIVMDFDAHNLIERHPFSGVEKVTYQLKGDLVLPYLVPHPWFGYVQPPLIIKIAGKKGTTKSTLSLKLAQQCLDLNPDSQAWYLYTDTFSNIRDVWLKFGLNSYRNLTMRSFLPNRSLKDLKELRKLKIKNNSFLFLDWLHIKVWREIALAMDIIAEFTDKKNLITAVTMQKHKDNEDYGRSMASWQCGFEVDLLKKKNEENSNLLVVSSKIKDFPEGKRGKVIWGEITWE